MTRTPAIEDPAACDRVAIRKGAPTAEFSKDALRAVLHLPDVTVRTVETILEDSRWTYAELCAMAEGA